MRAFALALSVLLGVAARGAVAATTCAVSTMSDVDFGANVDPVAGATANGSLTYSCTTSGVGSNTQVTAVLCFSIGDGTAGDGLSITPRRMTQSGTNPPYLNFNLYTNSATSAIWGTFWQPSYPPPQVTRTRTGNGTMSGTLSVYGRIPGNQTTITTGSYSDTFSAGHFNLDYRYREGNGSAPSDCRTGGTGGATTNGPSFAARATVPPACVIDAADNLNFPAPTNLLATSIDQTSTIRVACRNGTAWQIGLGDGSNAAGTQRRMRFGTSDYVRYELYRDSGRSQRWGSTLNTDTASGTSTGTAQTVTVYGRVPPQAPMPPAGTYKDTILVTVTY